MAHPKTYRPRRCNGCGQKFIHPGKHQMTGKCRGKGWSMAALAKAPTPAPSLGPLLIGGAGFVREIVNPPFCPMCGKGLASDARFCHRYGTKLSDHLIGVAGRGPDDDVTLKPLS